MPSRQPLAERDGDEDTLEALDPLAEAEALRVALVEAGQRVVRLINALKQFRKERRTLATVYSNLRQLNLAGRNE